MVKTIKNAGLAATSWMAMSLALAQAPAAPVLVAPEATAQPGRFMPGFGNEGLIKVRYTVKADGSVGDVEVTGYLTNQFLVNTIKQNVFKWTFKPGTADGKPIDFLNQEYMWMSRIDPNAPPPGPPGRGGPPGGRQGGGQGGPPGAGGPPPGGAPGAGGPPVNLEPIPLALSQQGKKALDAINPLVTNKEYDKALDSLNDMAQKDVHTVLDYAMAHQLMGTILMTQNKYHEALAELELATLNSLDAKGEPAFMLEDKILEQVLKEKLLLAVTLRHNAEAMETYAMLQKKGMLTADDKIHEQIRAAKALMDSPEPLALLAKLTDKRGMTHPLSRRVFTVADVKGGKLEKITARCDRRTMELKYQADVDWNMPASFGKCTLEIAGDVGTQFTLYEVNP